MDRPRFCILADRASARRTTPSRPFAPRSGIGRTAVRRLLLLALAAATAASVPATSFAASETETEGGIATLVVPPLQSGVLAAALRPLAAEGGALELSGETATLSFPLHLADGEARRGGTLHLAVESSVAVMPEASTLTVAVNGVAVGRIGLGGRKGAPLTIPLAASTLRPGWNVVRLSAVQRHRVDCRVQATYELWSRIDGARSGLLFDAAVPADLTALPAVRLAADGSLPIRLITRASDPERLATAFRLSALAARAAGANAATVAVGGLPGTGPGLDLVYGTPAEIADLGVDPMIAAAASSEPQFLPEDAGRPATLVVSGEGRRRLPAEEALAAAADRVGRSPLARPALEDATRPLAELGLRSEEFSGRFYRSGFDLTLPGDALIADYASVELALDAAYAPGLDPDARLGVSVNGRPVATLPFGKERGEKFDNRTIELPLSAFRPGRNRVSIDAVTSRPADATCNPNMQIAGGPRFLMLGSSTITVPKLARMPRLPELSATIAEGRTAPRRDAPVRLALAALDADTLSAAATLFTRFALVAADVPDLELVAADPADRRGALVVGAAGDLPASLAALAGVDDAALFGGSLARGASGHRVGDVFARLAANGGDPLFTAALDGGLDGTRPGDEAAMLDAWRSSVDPAAADTPLFDARGGLSGIVDDLARLVGLGGGEDPIRPDARTELVVAQTMPDGFEAPLTLVTAPTTADLASGVDRLVRPAAWAGLGGRAIVGDGEGYRSYAATQGRMVPTVEPSIGNLRLVVAAWFALNPVVYAGIVLLALVAFGALAARSLEKGRRALP